MKPEYESCRPEPGEESVQVNIRVPVQIKKVLNMIARAENDSLTGILL